MRGIGRPNPVDDIPGIICWRDGLTAPTLVIAIDGPSGVGKGTVARALAARLRFRHIDTGAMYRAVAWKAGHDGLDLDDAPAIAALARAARFDLDSSVAIDGHDVTLRIRTPEIDQAAALVARHSAVRAALVAQQRLSAGARTRDGRARYRHGGVSAVPT